MKCWQQLGLEKDGIDPADVSSRTRLRLYYEHTKKATIAYDNQDITLEAAGISSGQVCPPLALPTPYPLPLPTTASPTLRVHATIPLS